MLVIGLTGGIASGKTTISDLFSALKIPIVDTDIISRALLDKNQPGYENVLSKLGSQILLENGDINRPMLRQLVFNDSELKQWLEATMHPLIYQAANNQVNQYNGPPYVVLVVPLLFESKFISLIDRALVVDCSRESQLSRLVERDNIDETLDNKMLDQQWSNTERLALANDVIHNNDDENLPQQINRLHQQYLKISTPNQL